MDYSKETYKNLKKEFDKVYSEYSRVQDQCVKENLSFAEFCEKAHDEKEKLYLIDKHMRLKQTPSVSFGKKWLGELYTMEEFISLCDNESLKDSDGYGEYCTIEGKSDVRIYPSDIKENLFRTDFTHVRWYHL